MGICVIMQLAGLAGVVLYAPVLIYRFELAGAIRISAIVLCLLPPLVMQEIHTKDMFLQPAWLTGTAVFVVLYVLFGFYRRFYRRHGQ